MNGPGHYREAEHYLSILDAKKDQEAWEECVRSGEIATAMQAAQVHATLALAAATALCHPDERGYIAADLYRDWHKAAAS